MLDVLDAATTVRWGRIGLETLGAAREEIDALNVFPVADNDTGTNLYLTFEAAVHGVDLDGVRGLAEQADTDPTARHKALVAVLSGMADGAFNGARGNSGVILSQLLGALAASLADAAQADGPALALALRAAADAGYAAVAAPVEGTILTVASAAAQAALAVADRAAAAPALPLSAAPDAAPTLAAVAEAAATGARHALAATPHHLPVLARAGVVDAGGRGLCLLLDALADTLAGVTRPRPARGQLVLPAVLPPAASRLTAPPLPAAPDATPSTTPDMSPAAAAEAPADVTVGGGAQAAAAGAAEAVAQCELGPDVAPEQGTHDGAYEVMYLLDADAEAVTGLRNRLAALGGSLVVVGGPQQWNVHVHTDDAGAAMEAGIEAGRPHLVRITHLASALRAAPTLGGRTVLVLSTPDGLGDLFTAAGAHLLPHDTSRPPRTGPHRAAAPSSAAILAEVERCGTGEVIVVACDAAQHIAATVAAEQAQARGIRAGVVPAKAPVQAIAALAVHEPGRRFDADVVTMTAAAGATRVGALAVAEAQAWTTVGVCEAGDALGFIDGDVAVIGPDLADVAVTVIERMLAAGGELVTLLTGGDDARTVEDLVNWVRRHLRAFRPEVDVTVYPGGLLDCPLMIGVE